MKAYKTSKLTLSGIKYNGENLGSQWYIEVKTETSKAIIRAKLAHRKITPLNHILLSRNFPIESDLGRETSIQITAIEIDSGGNSDKGEAGKPWSINLDGEGLQEFSMTVEGKAGNEEKKKAKLTFLFKSEELKENEFLRRPKKSKNSLIRYDFQDSQLPVSTELTAANHFLERSKSAPMGSKVTLIGIQSKGEPIGSELVVEIAVNSYDQTSTIETTLENGGVELNIPVFNEVFEEGFDARLGFSINIKELDPSKSDRGKGGGFIDTYLEGIQKIEIPVFTVGGEGELVGCFELCFRVELCEMQEDDTGINVGGTTIGEGEEEEGEGGTTVTHPPEEEDTPTTPPPPPPPPVECVAMIVGPDCTCVDGVYQYKVISNCEGQVIDWLIEDENGDPSNVAKIVYEDDKIARVLILSNGIFVLKAYFLYKGEEIAFELQKRIEAIGVAHVFGDSSDAETDAIPMVQPHPHVEIEKPEETEDDECLNKGSDFLVHEGKIQSAVNLLHHSDPNQRISLEELGKEHLEVQLKVSGIFLDFFKEMNRCEWKVISKRVHSTDGGWLRKPQDFTDSTFETKIPGGNQAPSYVVLLKGLGKHEVRIIGYNAIERPGTDWIDLEIDLNEDAKKEVADRRRHLADLMSQVPSSSQLAAHAQRIANTQIAIEQAFIRGLSNPCITVSHNHQESPVFALPDNEKTRTQGKYSEENGPDMIPAEVRTLVETHNDLETKEELPQLYLNQQPVKNYWVTKAHYNGREYDWPNDGMIRGIVDEDITSKFVCCERPDPVFGVEPEVPDCVELQSFNETVMLKANGLPVVSPRFNNVGQYRWSVIAKPNEDAVVNIVPNTWTPSRTAQLQVDTAGRYTVKVEYRLGRASGLTFAVTDVKVIKNSDFTLQWELKRAGGYGGDLEEHQSLPLYQERKDEAVKAADMYIKPVRSGGTFILAGGSPIPLGTGVTIAPDNTMGMSFEGAFLIPKELAFEEEIRVRAYFKPYSPSLGSDDFEDFVGSPSVNVTPGAPYQLTVDIKAEKEIHAIHLLNIRYRHVQRLKGQAVPINFAYRLPEDEICPHEEVFMFGQGDDGWRRENPPLVNLIIFNRDLGDGQTSNAFTTLSNVGDAHNAANGNLFFELNLFETMGHGINQMLNISYNSLQSTYQDSLELYKRLNGISQDIINRHWCRNFIGKGWLSSYHLTVRYYVVPLSIDGRVKELFAEVVAPDGNRIQFKQRGETPSGNDSDSATTTTSSSTVFDGEYRPFFGSDYWMRSTELGHTLILQRSGNESVLKDINQVHWTFDRFGLLTEISEPLTRNTTTSNLKVTNTSNKTTIEDSSGRKTEIELIPEMQSQFSGLLKIKLPDGEETKLFLAESCITNLNRSSIQAWIMSYHDNIGQGDTCAVLKTLKDPIETEATYDYYIGEPFKGVPLEVARNFWGKLGKFKKGTRQVREMHWFYEGFDTDNQVLVFKNAVGVDFVNIIDPKRLALNSLSYIQKQRDTTQKIMMGSPNYDPRSQNSAQMAPKMISRYQYYKNTKLVSESTDLHGEKTKRTYFKVEEGRYLLEEITYPNKTKTKLEYQAGTALPNKIYTPSKGSSQTGTKPFTEYRYNANLQVTEVIKPSLRMASGEENGIKESWVFQDSTGRLESYTDVNNTKRTFGYREEIRDAQGVDLPTSVTVHMDNNLKLITQMGYDSYGRQTLKYDPRFGTITKYTFQKLGLLEREILQPIKTEKGSVEEAEIMNTYNAMGSHVFQATPLGTEVWIPDEHSQTAMHIDYANNRTVYEYYPSGALSKKTNPGGGSTLYFLDEIDRILRKKYPHPDNRTGAKRSDRFTVVLEYKDDEKKTIARRHKLNGNNPGGVLVENVDIFRDGDVFTQTTKTGGGPAFEKIQYTYDRWGLAKEVQWFDGDQLKKRMIQERDDWGRDIKQTHANRARSIKRSTFITYYHDGKLKKRSHEPTGTSGNQPESHFTYDKLGRLLTVKDKNNITLQSLKYQDFGNDPEANAVSKITETSQDPSAAPGTERTIDSQVFTYNRRGLVVLEEAAGMEREKRYDKMGRLVMEIEPGMDRSTSSGMESKKTELKFTLDALGRATKIMRKATVRNPGVSLSYLNKDWPDSLQEVETVLQECTYAWHGRMATQKQGAVTTHFEYDKHGRLQKRKEQLESGPAQVYEEVTYDGLDRVKRRVRLNLGVQTYKHNDGERKIEAEWRLSTAIFRATTQLNWSGQITDYTIDQNKVGMDVHRGYQDAPVSLKYEYDDLGDLKSKIYLRPGLGGASYGKIDYRQNGIGILREQDVSITSLDSKTIKQQKKFAYDGNQHLTKIETRTDIAARSNKWKAYKFQYNHGGFLKKYERPDWSPRSGDYSGMGIQSLYEHDVHGKLLRIREGLLPPQFESVLLELHYSNPQRQYISGNYLVAKKDLSPRNALKGVTYNFKYYGRNRQYAQDYMYDGLGGIETQVTSYTGINGMRKEDWRSNDKNSADPRFITSYRRFAKATSPSAAVEKYNYIYNTQLSGFGGLLLATGMPVTHGPFNSEFGRPQLLKPQKRKLAFSETRGIPHGADFPVNSIMISESSAHDETTPKPGRGEIHKGFEHNAAGQLVAASYQMLKREPSDRTFRSNISNTGHSLKNYNLFFYEPDGALMAQFGVTAATGVPNQLLIFINDGGTTLAEQDVFRNTFKIHDTLPGAGVRLGTTLGKFTQSDHDHEFWGECYYHWNHNGALTYLTDTQGRVAADFRFATAQNESDLFGENFDPAREPQVFSRMFKNNTRDLNAWELHENAPMSFDMAVSQVVSLLQRNEQMLLRAADLENPPRTSNAYGTTLAPFGYEAEVPSYANLIYHSTLDLFRGIGDALTAGYASEWRNAIYDHDQDLAGIRNPMTYIAGQITGTVISIYLSFAAAPLRAAQASNAARSAMLLTVTSDVLTFSRSVENIRSGKASFFDYLGLAAPMSAVGALRVQHTRNLKVGNSIDKARNAMTRVPSNPGKVAHIMVKPTKALKSDPQVMADLEKFHPVAEVLKKGRETEISEIMGNTVPLLSLSKETADALRNMGITWRRNYYTVGQVDEVYRKIWRKLLREAGEDLDKIAAGHRLDLGINRFQAAFEVRMFKWAMDGFVQGNPNIKKWLMNLMEKHGTRANSSSGSGITKQLMKKLDDGSEMVIEFLE